MSINAKVSVNNGMSFHHSNIMLLQMRMNDDAVRFPIRPVCLELPLMFLSMPR